MDYLKEGIGLRAMAQRNPLVEYQREGFDMFNAMLDSLKEEAVGLMFNLQVQQAEQQEQAPAQAQQPSAPPAAAAAAPAATGNGKPAAPAAKATGGPRHARPVPPQPTVAPEPVPSALQGKGLGGQTPQGLTFSGPSEGGGVQSRGDGTTTNKAKSGAAAGATRRERRAAAREQAKKNKRGGSR